MFFIILGSVLLLVGSLMLVGTDYADEIWKRAWWAFGIQILIFIVLLYQTFKAKGEGHSLKCSIRKASYVVF
jgi:hypothetical protein